MDGNITVGIICKNCGKESEITNPRLFFNSDSKKCLNCNSYIETGDRGIDEQILLYLRKGMPFVRAVILCKAAKNMSLKSAKQYVEFLAKQNNIKVNTGVRRPIVLIIVLAIAILIIGFAFISVMLAVK